MIRSGFRKWFAMDRKEYLVITFPFIFMSFFAVGYFIHGFFLGFKPLGISQMFISVAVSCIISIPFLVLSNRANWVYIECDEVRYAISQRIPVDNVGFQGRASYVFFYTIIFCGLSNLFLLVSLFMLWYLQGFKSLITDTEGLVHSFYAFLFLYVFIITILFICIRSDEKEWVRLGEEYESMMKGVKRKG
ncbi:MAG: hypothetical protein U9Q22_07190 [Candidatus Altiarchaeota archaeon]|nr:hypothetical protein [Candidatus Altiarchaeota archaeon]